MRLVLDTNVVLSALLWRGAPHKLVAAGREKNVAFYTSAALLQELAGVLDRRQFAKILAASRITTAKVLHEYTGFVHVVKAPSLAEPVCPDPDDDAVLACAVTARADLIVSGDSDLLDLKQHQGMPIIPPAEALNRIEAT